MIADIVFWRCKVIILNSKNTKPKHTNIVSYFEHWRWKHVNDLCFLKRCCSPQSTGKLFEFSSLGVHIDSTLSWSTHIEYIIKKATTRLYLLKQLKRAGLPNSHLLHFYITVIRPVLEYCAPVWHYALTKALSESLEAVQKRAIHITHNLTRGMPYSSMLLRVNLDSLATRREDLSRRFFPWYYGSCIMSPQPPSSTQIHRHHL